MRFGLATDPTQHEVDRWNEFNFHRIGIQCIFAGSERRSPDPSLSCFNLFAVAKRFAGGVVTGGAMIGHDYTNITNRDQSFGFDLNRAKPAIDEDRAVGQHLQLFAPFPSELKE